MSLAEWGLLAAVLAHSAAVLVTAVKLITWIVRKQTITEERMRSMQAQIDNDVTGRRVVGEMRVDIATIKAQVTDIRSDIKLIQERSTRP